ncbi:MAG: hypothetical protein ABMA15_20965 [Vicinamibacterales bacterium]
MTTHGSPFKSLALGLAIVLLAGILPTSILLPRTHDQSNGSNFVTGTVADTNQWLTSHPAAAARLDHVRKELSAQGFRVVNTSIMLAHHREDEGLSAWLKRLGSAKADEFASLDGGYAIAAELDDGNPNTLEYSLYANDQSDGAEFWGNVQFDANDPNNFWTWGEGGHSYYASNRDELANPLQLLFPSLAAVENCDSAGNLTFVAGRKIARDAVIAFAVAFIRAIPGCVAAGPGVAGCATTSGLLGFGLGLFGRAAIEINECHRVVKAQ